MCVSGGCHRTRCGTRRRSTLPLASRSTDHFTAQGRSFREALKVQPSALAAPVLETREFKKSTCAISQFGKCLAKVDFWSTAKIWKSGGAVGVPPPESRKPNRRVLQAQLRIYLDRTDASKRGLPCAADPVSRTCVESSARTSPSLRPECGAVRADSPRPVTSLD